MTPLHPRISSLSKAIYTWYPRISVSLCFSLFDNHGHSFRSKYPVSRQLFFPPKSRPSVLRLNIEPYPSRSLIRPHFGFFQTSDVCTTGYGAPIDTKTATMSVGPRGPLLLQDVQFLDEMSHFDRERIPERVVHAKGGGAFGYFEVTHDISKYCKAKIFDTVGKKTPCLVRFSTVGEWIYDQNARIW